MVAEHVKFGPVAYLLSILVSTPRGKVLYVWQLAASTRGARTGAMDVILLALRRLVHRGRVRKVLFTAHPESPEFRAIRRYIYTLFGAVLRAQQLLPASVSRDEREFVFRPMRPHL
jgi:hypothetical protein